MGEREDIFDDNLRSLMEDAEERVPKRVWSGLSKRLAAEGLQGAGAAVIIPLWAKWSAVGVAVAAALAFGVFLFMRGGESSIEDVLVAEVIENETVGESDVVKNEGDGEQVSESTHGIAQDGDDIARSEAIVAQSENIDNEGVSTVSEDSVGTSVADAAGVLASNGGSAVDAADVLGSDEVSDTEFGVLDSGNLIADNETTEKTSEEAAEGNLAEQLAESPKYIAEATDVADVADAVETADVAEAANAADASKPWSDPFAETARNSRSSKKTHTALTVSGNAFGNASSGSSSSSTGIRRQMSSSIDGQPAEGIAEKSDSNYGIPATFGVGVKIIFTPRWSLGVGLNYSLLSRTFSGEYTAYDAAGELVTNSYSNIRHRVDYIGIPVNAYFSIIQSHAVDFYAYAGGTIEKAVISRYRLDHGIPSYKESVKGVQCSTDIGIGVEFIVVDWLGIYIDPSLRYYFPNSHQPKSIRTQESLNFGFEIGLRFRL